MDAKSVAKLQSQITAFGGARSPVDQQIDGMRLVVAGQQIFEIPSAWSFHQFLLSYGYSQLGADWIATNAKTHPLVNHFTEGTAEENKATAQGTMTYFGTYTVSEADRTIAIYIEGSSFPNWNGADQKRIVTITGDQLKLIAPVAFGTPEVVWKRAQ